MIPCRRLTPILVLACVTHAAPPPAAAAGGTAELVLAVGEQTSLDATDIESFSESTRGVVEVKVPRDGSRFVVTALKPGATSLLLIHRGGAERTVAIAVFPRRPEAVEAELGELVAGLGGVTVRRVGARLFLEGTVADEALVERTRRLAALFPGQAESLVRVDAAAVRPRTNIRFDLTFVERRTSSGWDAGLGWPGAIGDTGTLSGSIDVLTGGTSASYQVVDQALPHLEAAARSGWARIRKRATLVTTSGNPASYSAGGEVNVAVAGSQAAELRAVPYGCRLAVEPRLAADDSRLDLRVEAEVADLTETTQDVPGRTVSKVATLVHLGLGQSIVLSGLDAESSRSSTEGLPLLSRIPILGLFFGTRHDADERVDGLIVITPSVIDRPDQDGRRRLEEALKKFADFDGDFEE